MPILSTPNDILLKGTFLWPEHILEKSESKFGSDLGHPNTQPS